METFILIIIPVLILLYAIVLIVSSPYRSSIRNSSSAQLRKIKRIIDRELHERIKKGLDE